MSNDSRSASDPALLLKKLREAKESPAPRRRLAWSRRLETQPGEAWRPSPAVRGGGLGRFPSARNGSGCSTVWRPGRTSLQPAFPLRLRGALDAGALEQALAALAARHESLRTTFRLDGEARSRSSRRRAPFASSARPRPFAETRTRGGRPAARRRAGLPAFDLEAGPLYRAFLIRLGERDHLLLQNLHHIISDGWSTGVLFRELRELLAAEVEHRPANLPAPTLQYADFALWQRGQLQGEKLSAPARLLARAPSRTPR